MGFWSWLVRLFSNDADWERREGKALRWERTVLPIPVSVDSGAIPWISDLNLATANVNLAVVRRVFLSPVEALGQLAKLYEPGPLEHLWPEGAVFVCVDPAVTKAYTEHQFDKRTGRIRSVRISLAPREAIPPQLHSVVLQHELGHALGLGHSDAPQSVMFERAHSSDQRLLSAETQLLRQAYA